jgi:hypothetical protein
MSEKYIDMDITDAVLEKPIGFKVGAKRYYLYPACLGVKMITSRIIEALNYKFTDNVNEDVSRLLKERRDEILRLIVHYTFSTKTEHYNEPLIEKRIKEFGVLSDEDISVLLFAVILDDVDRFKKHLGLDEDLKEQQRIIRLKGRKNTISFGGKSIYGTLIDTACERYGWTMDYVVWGISYTNLSMLLADAVKEVYLTDEEIKTIHPKSDSDCISADDLSNMNMILASNWE